MTVLCEKWSSAASSPSRAMPSASTIPEEGATSSSDRPSLLAAGETRTHEPAAVLECSPQGSFAKGNNLRQALGLD